MHARRFAGLSSVLTMLVAVSALAQNGPPQVMPPQAQVPVQQAVPQYEGESSAWRGTLERVAQSVVAIEIDQTRAFDTEWNSSSQATGFVVDAERGLILTNRHVVTPGPVTSEAKIGRASCRERV